MEVFQVYILYSASLDRYYIGQSAQLQDRLFRHNNSGSKSTKGANDWQLVYAQNFETRTQAILRETYIKKQKSRKYIENLIKSAG